MKAFFTLNLTPASIQCVNVAVYVIALAQHQLQAAMHSSGIVRSVTDSQSHKKNKQRYIKPIQHGECIVITFFSWLGGSGALSMQVVQRPAQESYPIGVLHRCSRKSSWRSVCVALGASKYHALPRLPRLNKTKLPIKHDITATFIWQGRAHQRNGREDGVASCVPGPMKSVHAYFDREGKASGYTTERCRGWESHVPQLGPRHGCRNQVKRVQS